MLWPTLLRWKLLGHGPNCHKGLLECIIARLARPAMQQRPWLRDGADLPSLYQMISMIYSHAEDDLKRKQGVGPCSKRVDLDKKK